MHEIGVQTLFKMQRDMVLFAVVSGGALAGTQGSLQPESKGDEVGGVEDEVDKDKSGRNKAEPDRRA